MTATCFSIWGEYLESLRHTLGDHEVTASCWDDGEALTVSGATDVPNPVRGTLHVRTESCGTTVADFGAPHDRFRIIAPVRDDKRKEGASPTAVGFVPCESGWQEVPVQIVPVRKELFSRFGGLLETKVLSGKRVLIVGLGTGGSFIADELAKNSVMQLDLVDHDRLEVANVARHVLGLSDIGRFKTKAMRDRIRQKNPYARIRTWERKVGWNNTELLRRLVREADAVVCAVDNRKGRVVLNKVCVEEKKPLIIAACFRRAYGGQILRVLPDDDGPCYQCYISTLPDEIEDQEVARAEEAENLAYTNRPVPIEPGLSTDIAPISVMVVKLVIQMLLQGRAASLRSLDEDLVAPFLIWMNRREAETPYENWEPLEFNVGGMHVLRWYGVQLAPAPNCPVCGDQTATLNAQDGPAFSVEKVNEFVSGVIEECSQEK